MQSPEALVAALAVLQDPRLVRAARRAPLPKGMAFLLETAVGEAEAVAAATAITGRSEAVLRKAAGFFIEQVLLSPQSDSYRILGADRAMQESQIRRHMALLVRWLHPDLAAHGASSQFDKSAYVSRVTNAWESIKTSERRAVYEANRNRNPYQGRSVSSAAHKMRRRQSGANWARWGVSWKQFLLLLAGRR
jgi:hypothetical protein